VEISADVCEAVAYQRRVRDDALHTNPQFTLHYSACAHKHFMMRSQTFQELSR